MDNRDHQIRIAAFAWLQRQVDVHGEVLPRNVLAQGFQFEGLRVPLVSPQGIFKPRVLEIPLSITTTSGGPYDDFFDESDRLKYRYRGSDPNHRDNHGLRKAMLNEIPLVYFHSVVPGKYLAVWPVYIIGDNRRDLTFTVAADNYVSVSVPKNEIREDRTAIRSYVTGTVRRRLHQQGFRTRVLRAYRSQCALCRLKHPELLDAAHILPDSDPEGLPIVSNGMSLCKLHHAAFDSMVIGISPDYAVVVREDVLDEIDGPMLKHGIKEMHGQKIILPRVRSERPNRDHLDRRFRQFLNAQDFV